MDGDETLDLATKIGTRSKGLLMHGKMEMLLNPSKIIQ